MELDIKGF